MKIEVLNKGFVRLVDHMGNDSRIVQAARVSYGKGTKSVSEDAGLIDYLMRNFHTSPFEQVVFTFHIKLPIFVCRQLIRHRTARVNEISGRYSVIEDDFYLPKVDKICRQSKNNKQGRGQPFIRKLAEMLQSSFEKGQIDAYEKYENYVNFGVARELARVNLPLSVYTEMYWQMDLNNLFKFLKLRLDDHAQYEIRVYAEAMAGIIQSIVPMAYSAFEENILNARNFSATEMEYIRDYLDIEKMKQDLNRSDMKRTRAREFLQKL